jgi:lipooligosaccharide transport system permease protein
VLTLAFSKLDFTDAFAVWRRNSRVYLRLWKTEMIAPIIEPIFSFFAFGFGVGALVASKVDGMSYLAFIGAGVLAFAVLMRSVFEMTYGAYFRMVYQSTYDAVLATPVNAESLAFGEILWSVTKGLVDSLFILPVVLLFGAADSGFTVLAVIPLLVGCICLSGFALGITAKIFDIDHFNIFFALFFSTIFLCGAWFPVELLPFWLKILAYIIPTTSVIDLTRACLSGVFHARHIYETIYLVVISFFLVEWAMRSIRKRMVV